MKITKEQGASLFFLVVGLYGLIFSIQLPFGKFNEPGPAMFPFGLSLLLFLSGLLGLILGRSKADKPERVDFIALAKKQATPAKIVLVITLYALFFERLGYLLTAFLFLFFLLIWVSRYRFWVSLCIAACIGIGSWLFFGKLLGVQFPRGLLAL